jgi:Tfp pilus assembly protein PilN
MTTDITGYTMTEADIEVTLAHLRRTQNPDATREEAIAFLEDHKLLAHQLAHKIVELEKDKTD